MRHAKKKIGLPITENFIYEYGNGYFNQYLIKTWSVWNGGEGGEVARFIKGFVSYDRSKKSKQLVMFLYLFFYTGR